MTRSLLVQRFAVHNLASVEKTKPQWEKAWILRLPENRSMFSIHHSLHRVFPTPPRCALSFGNIGFVRIEALQF